MIMKNVPSKAGQLANRADEMPDNTPKTGMKRLFSANGPGTIVVIGVLVGVAVGAVVYGVSHIHGIVPYLLIGAVVGAIAGLLFKNYWGSIALDEVTVSFPSFTDLTFKVTPDNRLVAWRFYIEVSTRVSTQALEEGTGKLREALDSLYALFQAIRGSLTEARPSRPGAAGPKVEDLAIAMLNQEMRPFMSKWHPALEEWEKANPDTPESRWPANAECRAALVVLQGHLASYADGFAELAGVDRATRPTPNAAV